MLVREARARYFAENGFGDGGGISEGAIQDALEDHNEDEMAYQATVKQAGKLAHLEWPQFRQKMYAHLARRGFNYEISAPVVARVWQELHEYER